MILKKIPIILEIPENTCQVSPNYTDNILTKQFSTIQAAIDYAVSQNPSENDEWTVLVENGIYNEQVIMAEYVALKGRNKETCIVERGTLPLVYNVDNTVINTITFRVTDTDGKFASIDGGGSQIEIQIYDCFLQGTGDDRNVLELANNVKAYLYETEGDNCGSGDIGKKIITSLASGSNIELYLEAAYICGGITWGGGNLIIFNIELLDDATLDINGGDVRLDYLWIENTSTYAIKFNTTGEVICKNLILESGGAENTIQFTAVPSYTEFTSCSIQSSGLYSIYAFTLISEVVLEASYLEKPTYNIQTRNVFLYSLTKLEAGDSETFTHSSDSKYARLVQISRIGSANYTDIDFDEADESLFIQEDATKTNFIGGQVQLAGDATFVLDSSGNGRNGVTVNNPLWVVGKLNNCLQFNGTNQQVNCGDIANFERTQPCSYEFWFNTTSVDTRLFLSNMEMPTPKGMRIAMMSGNIDIGFYNSGSNILKVHTNLTFNNGIFHHCIITYNGSSLASGIKIYVDNVLQSIIIDNNNLTATILNTATFRIAGRSDLIYFFNGKIDEVIIYDRELDSVEVANRYNGGTGTETLFGTAYAQYHLNGSGYDTTKGWYVRTNINQIDTSTWYTIGHINITATVPTNTNIKYLISVDNKVTWKKWTGTNWVTVSLVNIDTQGNTEAEIEVLTDSEYGLLFVAGTLDIVASLKTTDATATPSLSQIDVNYLVGSRHLCFDNDLIIEFLDATHTKITNTINPPETLFGLKVNIFLWGGGYSVI